MKARFSSLLWTVDVSAAKTLGGIYLGSNLRSHYLAISEADASDELILRSRGDPRSTFPGSVLMWASFVAAPDSFFRYIQSFYNFDLQFLQ